MSAWRASASGARWRSSSPSEKSVSQVAARWGLHHSGNFARDYAGLFGECPRETLRRI